MASVKVTKQPGVSSNVNVEKPEVKVKGPSGVSRKATNSKNLDPNRTKENVDFAFIACGQKGRDGPSVPGFLTITTVDGKVAVVDFATLYAFSNRPLANGNKVVDILNKEYLSILLGKKEVDVDTPLEDLVKGLLNPKKSKFVADKWGYKLPKPSFKNEKGQTPSKAVEEVFSCINAEKLRQMQPKQRQFEHNELFGSGS